MQLSGQHHEMHRERLGRDCARAFESCDLGVLCLCEFGNNKLDENLDAHLGDSPGFKDKYPGQNVNIWLEQVIQEFCTTSTDLQACVLGPYAIILNKSVCCFRSSPTLKGPLVTGTDHTYRRAVHSVIEVLPQSFLIEVWVHHAPSSKEWEYTVLAREQTMHYFFNNVSSKGIVGGNLNMFKIGIRTALRDWSSQTGITQEDSYQRRKAWQIHTLPQAQHGDLALTRGLTASQIEVTQQVKSKYTSKTHDLMVLQIDLENLPPHKRPYIKEERLLHWSLPAYDAMTTQEAPNIEKFFEECETLNLELEDTRARKFLATLDDAAHKRGKQ